MIKINDAKLAFVGTPNGGTQKNIDAIVLHHRAGYGDIESIHRQHLAQGWWGIGYHYYVTTDGEIWRGREEKWVGSHAGAKNGYNTHSIGICFEGNFEKDIMPPNQLIAGQELIADIKSRYNIKEIVRHSDGAATACPGRNFPFEELQELSPTNIGEGSEWSADARRWAITSGIVEGYGDGEYGWSDPITREQAATMLHRFAEVVK